MNSNKYNKTEFQNIELLKTEIKKYSAFWKIYFI